MNSRDISLTGKCSPSIESGDVGARREHIIKMDFRINLAELCVNTRARSPISIGINPALQSNILLGRTVLDL